jgi:hypothetical protein
MLLRNFVTFEIRNYITTAKRRTRRIASVEDMRGFGFIDCTEYLPNLYLEF